MSEYDFSRLYSQYPSIIRKMPQTFTSHQFILELARCKQVPYIEALYHYRGRLRDGKPAPFMILHGILAQYLFNFPILIEQVRKNTPSKDIFGQDNVCTEWRRR